MLPGYYLRFSRPVMYSKFGDLLEQDEFNAVSFYSKCGSTYPQLLVNSHNVVGIMHKLNIVYFYSLCRHLMTNLSHDYAVEIYAGIQSEKFNLVMRGASYEKSMTATHLKDIQQECIDFGVNILEVVELFHSLLNKPSYNYELNQETEYDKFCHTSFPNRFVVLDDFSGVELQFIEEEEEEKDSSIMDTSITNVFDDSYRGDGGECEIILQSLNDTVITIDEEHIISKTCGPDLFQESLNVAFKEYKTIKSKYVLLQEDMSRVQCENEHLLNEINILKEESIRIKNEKLEMEHKLKESMEQIMATFKFQV